MNIRYEIDPDRPDTIPDVAVRVQAVNKELRDEIRALVERAVHEGQLVAEREAPRGEEHFREGLRIRDAVRVTEIRYAPGGAGGGGFYEASLYVDSALAPQVEFVMEGTADEGAELITPSKGNLGGVVAFEKEGEGTIFRKWVHGQRPNTGWWNNARDEVERILETGIHEIQ